MAALVLGLIAHPAFAQTWTTIAVEGQTFAVSGTQTVRFGYAPNWVQMSVTGSGTCSSAAFGSDPYPGTYKECDVQGSGLPATSTSVVSAAHPATLNVPVTLTATVTGASPTGTVSFRTTGLTTVGTATLTGTGNTRTATYSATFPTAGVWPFSASYGGDSANSISQASTGSLTVAAASTTTLASSVNPSGVGATTLLTATVAGAAPTGTVTFKDGATALGTGTLGGTGNSRTATYSASFASAGSHGLTAVYGGDSANPASTSSAVSQTVNARATSTALAASSNPTTVSQSTTLTATVTGTSPGGTVTFKDGSTTLGTGTVASGVASYAASFATAGAHSLTAVYGGDANNLASTSSALAETVNAAATLPSPPVSPVPVANYEYDAQGNPTRTIQAPGATGFAFATQASYDSLNRVKNTTNAKSGVTQFGYDGREDMTQVTDPRNLLTQYPRNGLGDATSAVSPDTGTATQTYDAAGNLKTRTDSRGVLATYSYDALNRPTGVTYTQSGQTTLAQSWSYDQTGTGYANGVGRLTSTTHPAGSTQYTYDPQGRLLTDIQRVSAATGANAAQISTTVSYGYDAAGHITSIVYPSGRKLTVTYAGGLPTALALAKDSTSTATTLIDTVLFSPFAGPLSWNWQMTAGAQANSRVFDTSGRIVRYRLGGFVRDLTYDAAGRITGYTHYDATSATATAAATALNQSFGYDELGRLTTVTAATSSWTIGYDANGNRTGVTLNATTSAYTVSSSSNRLTSLTNPTRSFGYDNAGNTTSDSTGYSSTYNLANRLATLTKAGVTASYTYDAMGHRVRKVTSAGASSTVVFVYDQNDHLLGEYDSSGAALREYVWLGDTPIAIFTPDTVATNPPLVFFIHTDHLGTPRVVVDKANNLRWRWMAEPFGTSAPETNPQNLGIFTQNLRFPGQYNDQESGLSYNFFRDYDSSLGRYVQSDPIGLAGGINAYAYVGGNPLNYVDSMGLQSFGIGLDGLGGSGSLGGAGTAGNFGGAAARAQSLSRAISALTEAINSCKCMPATPENIRPLLNASPMLTLQPTISAGAVQSWVSDYEMGVPVPPIQVEGNIIVDGNHRYIASLLCRKPPAIQPWTAPLTRPRMPIRDLQIQP